MNIDFVSLNEHLQEYAELSEKPRLSKDEQRRCAYLQTAISALKAGATMEQVDEARKNGIASKYGLQVESKASDREIEARGWKALIEERTMTEGSPLARLGSYSALGFFVPTEFFPQVFSAMAAADCLLDEDACTVIKTNNGRVTTVPTLGDIENIATPIDEAAAQTSTNIYSTNQVVLSSWGYKTPRMQFSREVFQDVDETINAIKLFTSVSASRLARGIAKHLVTGTGSSQPQGLVTSLSALGVPYVTASGSAETTGGSETGANSVGISDIYAMLDNIDQAYLDSPKAAFFMNRRTLNKLSAIVNKFGDAANLVQWVGGIPYIMGVRVRIAPSLDNIGASATPILLGDGQYWITRLVNSENAGIRVYSEATGLAENGCVGLSCFLRADGALAYTDTSSPAPFTYLRCHS
jgi:HK97 family phage major capsid protein